MNRMKAWRKDLSRIGILMPEGLPHKEYAISDGTVTVILDQGGGINMIEYQGPRRIDGKRRGAFYSNGVWRGASFFPEPVIEFELKTGRRSLPFHFKPLTVAPFGATASFSSGGIQFEYRVWIRGKAVLFEWRASAPAEVSLKVREGFLQHHNDESQWEAPTFDGRFTAIRYNLLRNFTVGRPDRVATEHRHGACSMIGCFSPAKHGVDGGVRQLTAALSSSRPCRFAITFGEDVREVEWRLRDARLEWEAWLADQIARYVAVAKKTPRLKASGDATDALSELIRVSPLFVESTRRVRNCCQAAFRASTRGYGIFNAWDGQWACMVVNACGDDETVRKYLNFLEASRGPNHAISMVTDYDFGPLYDCNLHTPEMERELGNGYQIQHEMFGIANLHQYYFRTGDRATLGKLYPSFARSLHTICANASQHGLVGSCFGGADYPDQANRPAFEDKYENRTLTSRLCGVEDMSILYSGCAQGAELAAIMNDRATVRDCVEVMERLQENYLRLYLDEETGYLIDAVWFKDNPVNKNRFFRLTSLLALYGYGELLMLDAIDRMAAYVKTYLRHPVLGLCDVPRDHPPLPAYSRWEDHWLQNATKESLKLARLANDRELLDIQVNAFLKHFDCDKLIHEDLYHAYEGGKYKPENVYHSTSWWQNMTAHAWWNGMIESVAGLRYERGPLEYVPGDSGRDVTLSNFHWAGRRWKLRVMGRGKWIAQMRVNGRPRSGVYQIQPGDKAFDQEIRITKTDNAPNHPVILSAGCCAVTAAKTSENRLEAALRSPGFVLMHFYSPGPVRLSVNGKKVKTHWVGRRSEGVAWLKAAGDLKVVIEARQDIP